MVRSSRVLHHLQAREGRLCTSLLATCWWSKLYVQLSLRGCGADSLTSTPTSLLSIINKFAVLHFPYPAALTGFQYAVSAAAVIVLYVCAVLSLSLSLLLRASFQMVLVLTRKARCVWGYFAGRWEAGLIQ